MIQRSPEGRPWRLGFHFQGGATGVARLTEIFLRFRRLGRLIVGRTVLLVAGFIAFLRVDCLEVGLGG